MTTIARKIAIATQLPWPIPARSTMSSLMKIENGGIPARDNAASMSSVAPGTYPIQITGLGTKTNMVNFQNVTLNITK